MGTFNPLPTFYFPHEHTVQYTAKLPRRRRLNSTGSYDINDCKECGGNFKGGGSLFANRKAHGMHVHVPKIKFEFSSEESSTDDESRAVETGIQTSPALMLKDFWKSRVPRFRKKVIKWKSNSVIPSIQSERSTTLLFCITYIYILMYILLLHYNWMKLLLAFCIDWFVRVGWINHMINISISLWQNKKSQWYMSCLLISS